MKKKILSIIMILILTVTLSGNVFATPTTNEATTLKQTQDNKKKLKSQVQNLDNKIDDVIKQMDNNKRDMNKVAEDIKHTQVKLEAVETKAKEQEELFRKRARVMYINGVDSYLEVILSASSVNDFISRLDMLSTVMKFDKNIIAEVKEQKEAIVKQKSALEYENNKLEALNASSELTLSKLNKSIKEQKDLLAKVTEKEKNLIASEKSKELAYNTSSTGTTLSRGMPSSLSYSKIMYMESTAYSTDAFTSSGSTTRRNPNGYSTIAVDPRVIPLGSTVYVEGYGYAVAEDTGGAIKGNIIDVFFKSESEANNWGRKHVKVYIVNN